MEDGFEILIYILFVVLSLIGGLYKNYIKRKEEEAKKIKSREVKSEYSKKDQYNSAGTSRRDITEVKPQEPQVPKSSPFEEFIKQQFEILEEPGTESPPVLETESPIAEEEPALDSVEAEGTAVFKSTTDELLSDNMNEKDFSISDSIETLEGEKEGEVYNYNYNIIAENEISDEKILIEEFDGRKAVIYSEILKRPDF